MNLSGKRALLTGAGSGIGRATAIALAKAGAAVALVGRREAPLRETAKSVEEAGGKAAIFAADITDAAVHTFLVEGTVAAFGGLDLLVNNAGAVRAGRLETFPDEDVQALIAVNLTAPILLTREALPELRRSGDAVIVNVASAIALVGIPFYAVYAAVKAGIANFSEALNRELLGEGVRVMTVYPGATDTPMMESSKAGPELGFAAEPASAVAQAIVDGLRTGARTVLRGGEMRQAMIALNRERPQEVDERFAHLKPDLELAVATHRSI